MPPLLMPEAATEGHRCGYVALAKQATNTSTYMEKIVAGSPETHSTDIVAENLARLQSLFPEAFAEGKVDFDVLRQLLGDAVDEREEKYGLKWYGKRRARKIALTPSTGTLRPCPEDSVDWDTTQNLMIEGDNLEVLKLMQKSYAEKIKLIYIDPPYNTGKDFVYTDDYRDNIKNYLTLTGQMPIDDSGGGAIFKCRNIRAISYAMVEHDVSAPEAGA